MHFVPPSVSFGRFARPLMRRRQPSADSLKRSGALLQARRFEEAEAATRKILDATPRNVDARALLALILDQRGQTG